MRNVAWGLEGWGATPSDFGPVGDSCLGDDAVWEAGETESCSCCCWVGDAWDVCCVWDWSSATAAVWVRSWGGYMMPGLVDDPPASW